MTNKPMSYVAEILMLCVQYMFMYNPDSLCVGAELSSEADGGGQINKR